MDREPCPWRLVDDAGGAFAFGAVGGTVWHFFGGIRNAPRGQRTMHAINRIRARVPALGGSFAVWGAIYCCFDCTFTYARGKEDPWNSIMSGALTGGVLAMRAGVKAAARNAVGGGVILAAIEGLNIALQRVLMPLLQEKAEAAGLPVDDLDPPLDPFSSYRKKTRLWDPISSTDSSSSLSRFQSSPGTTMSGFDIDSVTEFDQSTSDSWSNRSRDASSSSSHFASASSTAVEQDQEQKPFWKIW